MGKLISGRMYGEAPIAESSQAKPETTGESVLRNLTGSAVDIASLPFQAYDILSGLSKTPGIESALPGLSPEFISQNQPEERIPSAEGAKRYIAKKLGKEREYLEPRSDAEKGFRWLTSELPFLKLGGGSRSILKQLGLSALGDAAAKGVESVGGGEIVQAATRAGVPFAVSKLRPGQLVDSLSDLNRTRYSDVFKESEKQLAHTSDLNSYLSDLYSEATEGAPTSWKKKVSEVLPGIDKLLQGGMITIDKLINIDKDLTSNIYERGTDKIARAKLLQVQDKVHDLIEKSATPQLFEKYKDAKSLHSNLARVERAKQLIKDSINPAKLAGAATSSLLTGLYTGNFAKGASVLGAAGIGALLPSVPAYKSLLTSKDGKKLILDIAESALKENPKALANNILKFDRAVTKEEKSQPITNKYEFKGGKLISGKAY